MRIRPFRSGAVRTVGLVALLTTMLAGSALAVVAAAPEKGKTYSGKIKRYGTPISFAVSQTGKSVSHFKIKYAPFIFCQGGGVTMKSRSAGISGGAFTARLPLRTVNGKPYGHITVAGTFAKSGKEAGKVTVAMRHASSCNGSSSYSTKAG